jgi:hypothetical protein
VQELSALRESQDAFETEETRLLQSVTVQESAHQWLVLQCAFEPQLQQMAALSAPERQAALAQLQLRLRRVAEWQEQYGKPLSIHSGTSKATGWICCWPTHRQ